LFHPATVPGLPPLQSLPLPEIGGSSLETTQLPRGYPPACSNAPLVALSPPVSPTPTRRARSRLVPPLTMDSLSTGSHLLPGHPGPRAANRPIPPASPASKRFSLRESVRDVASCPAPPAAALLGFCLSRDPRKPRILRPARTEVRTRTLARRLLLATSRTSCSPKETLDPRRRVRPLCRREATGSTSSTASSPLQDWAAPPLDGDSCSLGLKTDGEPPTPTFEAFKYLRSVDPPKSADHLS